MKFLQLEYALNEIAGYGVIDGPFYGMAGALEGILKDKSTNGQQKATELAEIIKSCFRDHTQKLREDNIITSEEYAKKVGRSIETVNRWMRAGKVPGAFQLGHGKSSRWGILAKK